MTKLQVMVLLVIQGSGMTVKKKDYSVNKYRKSQFGDAIRDI